MSKRKNVDSPWKEALSVFFQDFLALCFPHIANDIDWTKEYTFLDKELRKMMKDAVVGSRTVDKLVKVVRRNGEEACVLIHVEVQGQRDQHFAERMYIYHYKLFDRYRIPIASLAMLIDANKQWQPQQYISCLWKTNLRFDYEVVKLLDYQETQAELVASANPFAVVILAQLTAIELHKKKDSQQCFISKLALTKLLYKHGWSREKAQHLFRFIDWMIQLPQDLMVEYEHTVIRLEEGKENMAYVTQTERLWRDRGLQQGVEEGLQIGIKQGIERGIEKGMQKGMQKGMEQGMEKGMEKGIERGIDRGQAQIVKKLYETLRDAKEVARLTKLSTKKINMLLSLP